MQQQTVWDDVCTQSEVSPRAVAIRDATVPGSVLDISYAELAASVAELSAEIAGRSDTGSLIALDAATHIAGVIAILAAAAAGRAILPLNNELPPILRHKIMADARPALILTAEVGHELRVEGILPCSGWSPRHDMAGVAYVLYTSGSTGLPKGVVVPHQALRQRLKGLAQVPGLRRDESIMAMTALSFDISLAEMLLPISVGGTVISAPPAVRLDPAIFAEFVDQFHPDVLQATPSFWRLVLAWGWRGSSRARVWCGGEALTPTLAERLLPLCGELWNLYGPTEATIWVTAARIAPNQPISLGEPLPGSGLLIADTGSDADTLGRMLTGPDQPGEIWVYGAGLANRYLDRPELTRDRFRLRETPGGVEICYKTGDRGQYRDDGSLEFLGRTDNQVKLRGHRIELGEVEAVLEECPGVLEAAALIGAADRPKYTHLAAFLVTDGTTTSAFVRQWAVNRLPPVMRPGKIFLRAALPRTAAGKVDRVQLAREYYT